MTRAEKVARARELRAQGLTVVQVAAAMGVSRNTIYAYLSDPDLSKQRARREGYRGRCVDCGARTNGSAGRGPNAPTRCASCNGVIQGSLNGPRLRARFAEHRALIERLWAEGRTCAEIAEACGIPAFGSGPYRQHGYNLPHRRTPEQVARIAAGRRAVKVAA